MWFDTKLANFASPTQSPSIDLAVDHHAAAYARTDRSQQKVKVGLAGAQPGLGQGVAVHIVVDSYWQPQPLCQPRAERKATPAGQMEGGIGHGPCGEIDLACTGHAHELRLEPFWKLMLPIRQDMPPETNNALYYVVRAIRSLRLHLCPADNSAVREEDSTGHLGAADVEDENWLCRCHRTRVHSSIGFVSAVSNGRHKTARDFLRACDGAADHYGRSAGVERLHDLCRRIVAAFGEEWNFEHSRKRLHQVQVRARRLWTVGRITGHRG